MKKVFHFTSRVGHGSSVIRKHAVQHGKHRSGEVRGEKTWTVF